MFPDIETAIRELEIAGQMNPGPWVKHSYNVANAARIIAEHCKCWNRTLQLKDYFEEMIGTSIYKLLPYIEECIYR